MFKKQFYKLNLKIIMHGLFQLFPIVVLLLSFILPLCVIYWLYLKINYFIKLKEEQNDILNEILVELRAKKG